MSLNVQGMEALRKRFESVSNAMRATVEGHERSTAGAIMQEAQRTVPVVTGRLRSSAFVRERKRKGAAACSFGYEAPYAVYVHEIPYRGTTTRGLPGALRNGKGYKWLERAAKKMAKNAVNLLRAAISETLATGKPVDFNVPPLEKGGKAGFESGIGMKAGGKSKAGGGAGSGGGILGFIQQLQKGGGK